MYVQNTEMRMVTVLLEHPLRPGVFRNESSSSDSSLIIPVYLPRYYLDRAGLSYH